MLRPVRRKSAVRQKVPDSKAEWKCGKSNRPSPVRSSKHGPAPRDGGMWRRRDRAGRRRETATRSTNRGLSQPFRTAGAHEQADPDASVHALPMAASGRGRVGRAAALAMNRGKSVDFTRYWRPPKKRPQRRGASGSRRLGAMPGRPGTNLEPATLQTVPLAGNGQFECGGDDGLNWAATGAYFQDGPNSASETKRPGA
jgi:hypothetical protein